MMIVPRISARSNRFTNQVIHNGCIALLLSLRCCPATALLLFSSCMTRTFVSRLHRVEMPMVLIMIVVCSHISPCIRNSYRWLCSFLVHLILHEDSFWLIRPSLVDSCIGVEKELICRGRLDLLIFLLGRWWRLEVPRSHHLQRVVILSFLLAHLIIDGTTTTRTLVIKFLLALRTPRIGIWLLSHGSVFNRCG